MISKKMWAAVRLVNLRRDALGPKAGRIGDRNWALSCAQVDRRTQGVSMAYVGLAAVVSASACNTSPMRPPRAS